MSVGTHEDWMRVAEARQGSAGHATDGRIGCFYDKAVQNVRETERQGRAVYEMVPYVEIILPGTPNQRPNMRATDEHKKWFPTAWQAYLERKQGLVDGTPLEQWPYLNPAQIAELKHAGVYSVEALAAVTDGSLKNLGMHGRDLRERAKQFLQPASTTEQELRAALAERDKRLAALEAQFEQMRAARAAEGDEADEPPARKPGRPRKVAA